MPAASHQTAEREPATAFSKAEDPLQRLRAQLIDMRAQLVTQLAEGITGGDMALLSSVVGAIAGGEAEIARDR
jgi:hypothetical protein